MNQTIKLVIQCHRGGYLIKQKYYCNSNPIFWTVFLLFLLDRNVLLIQSAAIKQASEFTFHLHVISSMVYG